MSALHDGPTAPERRPAPTKLDPIPGDHRFLLRYHGAAPDEYVSAPSAPEAVARRASDWMPSTITDLTVLAKVWG
jgi:hypothetical protein